MTSPSLALDLLPAVGPFRPFRDTWLDRIEKHYVAHLLQRHGHNVSSAAREAELDRTYLHRLIKKHNG